MKHHYSFIDAAYRISRNGIRYPELICSLSILGLAIATSPYRAIAQEELRPKVLDAAWQMQLVASEPELVTPVSCRFDGKNRLIVVESHTHFPPEDYPGPKTDRIYLFDQLESGDGSQPMRARKRLFYEGGRATMGLAVLEDDWIVVATRSEVIKIRDSDGDDRADESEVLLRLQTDATYPHNGLGGVAVGPDGLLYIGQGENFGEEYQLVAADGSRQVGGGEGGNIFRCTIDGGKLERIATGFWNPFGLYFDPAGRLWAVGNDPDARPPCRLLHVVQGGDYGFQFRFGRAGTHPLLSWNGEFPGTLPMVSGTGEAPCAVVAYEGALWVTSWGSNRIERFSISPQGATWSAKMDVIVQGDGSFRPVDMAVAPDGSLYFTDWVDRSYPVHGRGRLWRLSKRDGRIEQEQWPQLTGEEKRSRRLASVQPLSDSARVVALDESDPFVWQSAVTGLCQSGELAGFTWDDADSPGKQLGLLAALRWHELSNPESLSTEGRSDWIDRGLQAAAPEVNLAALRWATERNENRKIPAIRDLLQRKNLSTEMFAAAIAAVAYLETGSAAKGVRDPAREELLYHFASKSEQPAALRAMAVQLLPAESDKPTDEELGRWIMDADDRRFGGEIVRLLSARARKSAWEVLAAAAANKSLPSQVRADAVAGLVKSADEYRSLIGDLASPHQPEILRSEAERALRRDQSGRAASNPKPDDIHAWDELLGGGGDAEAGRRVFFRTTCANCHPHSGRGSRVGPDLTKISGQMSRERLLESILQPSREVAPLYVPWRVLTTDGRILTGMRLETSGTGKVMHFLNAESVPFDVAVDDIEAVEPSEQSIMPDGLEATMSHDEFRDLLSFLLTLDS